MLSDELLALPAELARVDALLDDPVFFTPFVSICASAVAADKDLFAFDVPQVPLPAGLSDVVPGRVADSITCRDGSTGSRWTWTARCRTRRR